MMGMRFRNRAGVLLAFALVIGLASMASIAPLWTGWAQQQGPKYAPPGSFPSSQGGALPAGVSFLPDELGGARLVVEIAFGANVADITEASWIWYDVSADVHYDPGIHISPMGRQSESQSAPPAECTFELDNTSNKYSPFNPLATYWPNVKEGTPIRVRVIISGVSYTRFQGRAIGFNPTPDSTGYHQMITVTAAGVTRVIGQQSDPVLNPTDRAIQQQIGGTALAGGWSFEQSQVSTSVPNVIPGGPPVTFNGVWNATLKDGPVGSDQLPEWGQGVPQIFTTGANLTGVSGYIAVDVDMRVGANVPLGTGGPPAPWAIYTNGTYRRFWFTGNWASPDQQMLVLGEHPDFTQTNLLFTQNAGAYAGWNDGVWHHYRVIMQDSAGSLLIKIYVDGVLNNSTTVGSTNLSQVASVQPFPDIAGTPGYDFEFGHLYVWKDTPPDMYSAFAGHPDETPAARLSRVMSENGYAFNTIGFYDTRAVMGPQVSGSLDTIARSCEATEAGWLYDGLTGGTSFMAPSQRYDQFTQFTLDGTKGEVQPDFWPVQDDFARANKVTITNSDNSSSTYEDDTGPNGTAAVGVYTGNAPTGVNYADGTYLDGRARWEVHKGTAFGYRWPTINVNVRKIPDRAAKIAAMTPGLRFTIYPMPVRYQLQYGTDPVELIAEGWSEFLTQVNWEIAFNCSSQDIYNVWKVGDSQLGRAGTGGLATLASDAAAGASTISLATPAGTPLWTTLVGDFPLSILVDGIKVTLTAISGSSSPQTGTVDTVNTPIPRLIQANQVITMWKNGVIKL